MSLSEGEGGQRLYLRGEGGLRLCLRGRVVCLSV